MSDQQTPPIGSVGWFDLTIPDAERVRDFYGAVAGWTHQPVEMGGYSDYTMIAADGKPVGGVCHARGVNKDLPPQWLIYITVADIEKSVAECTRLGGKSVTPIKDMGSYGRYCVIEDPAGAAVALIQPK